MILKAGISVSTLFNKSASDILCVIVASIKYTRLIKVEHRRNKITEHRTGLNKNLVRDSHLLNMFCPGHSTRSGWIILCTRFILWMRTVQIGRRPSEPRFRRPVGMTRCRRYVAVGNLFGPERISLPRTGNSARRRSQVSSTRSLHRVLTAGARATCGPGQAAGPASGPNKAVTGAASGPRRHDPSEGGPTGRQRENDSEANRNERRHESEPDLPDDAAARHCEPPTGGLGIRRDQ